MSGTRLASAPAGAEIAPDFASTSAATSAQARQWLASWQDICRETRPWLRMTASKQPRNLADLHTCFVRSVFHHRHGVLRAHFNVR